MAFISWKHKVTTADKCHNVGWKLLIFHLFTRISPLQWCLSFHLSRFSFILLFVQYRSWNCCYVWVYVNLLKMGIKRDDSSYRWILLPSKYPQPSPCSSCTLSNSSTSRPQWSLGNMLASRSKVRRFKPDWSRRIFPGRKNPEHKSSRRDFKLGVPSLRFQAC